MTRDVFGDVHDPEQLLGELAGAVSLCWEPRPTGEFDSTAAGEFVDAAVTRLRVLISDSAIRADERVRAIAEVQEKHRYEVARLIAEARADQDNRECDHCTDLARLKIADLRAKVEALPHTNKCDTQDPVYAGRSKTMCTCWQAAVLALIDGSSDERE